MSYEETAVDAQDIPGIPAGDFTSSTMEKVQICEYLQHNVTFTSGPLRLAELKTSRDS